MAAHAKAAKDRRTAIVRAMVTPEVHAAALVAFGGPGESISTWIEKALRMELVKRGLLTDPKKAKNGAAHPPPEEGGGP